jgi:hypothetical protein
MRIALAADELTDASIAGDEIDVANIDRVSQVERA